MQIHSQVDARKAVSNADATGEHNYSGTLFRCPIWSWLYSRNKVAGVYFHFVYPERWQSSARGNGINNLFDNKKDGLCWTLCLITKVKWKQQLWYCSIRFTGKSGQIVVSHVIREIYYSVDAILIIYSSVVLRSVLLCLLHFQLC